MKDGFKPAGYSSIAPYIVADGVHHVIDFLSKTFDVTPLRRFENPDGTINHAEVQIDDSVIMFGEGGEGFPGLPVFVHVYVPDVDVTYRRALEAGGVSVQEPQQKDDPDRRAGVKDPAGNTWWIATQVG